MVLEGPRQGWSWRAGNLHDVHLRLDHAHKLIERRHQGRSDTGSIARRFASEGLTSFSLTLSMSSTSSLILSWIKTDPSFRSDFPKWPVCCAEFVEFIVVRVECCAVWCSLEVDAVSPVEGKLLSWAASSRGGHGIVGSEFPPRILCCKLRSAFHRALTCPGFSWAFPWSSPPLQSLPSRRRRLSAPLLPPPWLPSSLPPLASPSWWAWKEDWSSLPPESLEMTPCPVSW